MQFFDPSLPPLSRTTSTYRSPEAAALSYFRASRSSTKYVSIP
jgi:hypothetical protein